MIKIEFNAEGRELRTEERKIVNAFLDERDGLGCQAAEGKPHADGKPCAGPIVIHHIDNNKRHNLQDGSNWSHRCQGHNHRANPRGKSRVLHQKSLSPKGKSTPLLSLSLKREQRHLKSPQMVKSEAADRFFRQFIAENILDGIEIHSDELLDGARNAFTKKYGKSVEQSTLEKVLSAVTSRMNGDYELDEDTNMVRVRKRG